MSVADIIFFYTNRALAAKFEKLIIF